MPRDYYAILVQGLGKSPNRKGEVYVPCPRCKKSDQHFSFSPRGALCFTCGFKPSLRKLVNLLLGGATFTPDPVIIPAPKPRPWQSHPEQLADSFSQTPGNASIWQAYKPLPDDAIRQHQLGLGVFPGGLAYRQDGAWVRCEHRRLIVPLFEGGRVVGFRCRAFECDHKKWLSPGGTQMVLYNAPAIRAGEALLVVENPLDALLLCACWGLGAVATLGVTIWKPEYTQLLKAAPPSVTVFGYDSDPNAVKWARKRADELTRQGLCSQPFDWSLSPGIKDFGEFFMAKERKENLTLKLAQWFVTEYLGREWKAADFRGSHMAHAAQQLKTYSMPDIVGCLTAVKVGMLPWPFAVEYLATITKGEPPLIEQWLSLKENPPPIWNRAAYNQWARMTGHDELQNSPEPPPARMRMWPGDVRPDEGPGQAG